MLTIEDHGSLVLIRPDAEDRENLADWIAENVSSDALSWGSALVVEHRFVADIVAGLAADGFEIKGA